MEHKVDDEFTPTIEWVEDMKRILSGAFVKLPQHVKEMSREERREWIRQKSWKLRIEN